MIMYTRQKATSVWINCVKSKDWTNVVFQLGLYQSTNAVEMSTAFLGIDPGFNVRRPTGNDGTLNTTKQAMHFCICKKRGIVYKSIVYWNNH